MKPEHTPWLAWVLARGALILLVLVLGLARPCSSRAGIGITLGVVTSPGTAQYIAAEKFKELAEQSSGGEISVSILHSGSLGSETEILQQIQMNAVQMGVITLGPVDVFTPEVRVVEFPFLFKDYEQAHRILDGPLGDKVLGSLAKAKFKGLAFSENGFRNLTNSARPVHAVKDVEGLKIRVMESKVHNELWRLLGANPTPMPWPITTELEQKTIDGQENPLSVLVAYKLYEVQKYLSLTRHVYSAHVALANLDWFEALPLASQTLIRDSMRQAASFQRAWNRDNLDRFLAELEGKGMVVDERPDLASFQTKAEPLRNMDVYAEPAVQALLL